MSRWITQPSGSGPKRYTPGLIFLFLTVLPPSSMRDGKYGIDRKRSLILFLSNLYDLLLDRPTQMWWVRHEHLPKEHLDNVDWYGTERFMISLPPRQTPLGHQDHVSQLPPSLANPSPTANNGTSIW
jgi:hypothetical protein